MYFNTIPAANINVNSSAAGTASHTPVTPMIRGNNMRKAVINPNVRKKEIRADIFPFESAVNRAEAKILHPENRKLYEKREKPVLVISKTFLLFFANTPAIDSPAKKEIRNTVIDRTAIKQKQVQIIFFNRVMFLLP
mgnify:CR=1 FL=1